MPELKIKALKQMRDEFVNNSHKQAVQNAVMKNGLKKSVTNQTLIDSKPFVFSIDVDSDKVLDQKKSGRCWIFSALNFLRYHIEKDFNIKNMELSPNYVFFYDKLEKSNYFYQNIIDTAKKPLSNRRVNWLLTTPEQDGGDWYQLVSLFEKYGVIPKALMDETSVSVNTSELNFVLTRKLQTDAIKLRKMVNNDASKDEIKTVVKQMNAENYNIISASLDTPPETFNYKYRDKDNKFHSTGEITPQEFFKKFVKINLDDYVEILNLPGKNYYPFNQTYFIEFADNMVQGVHNRYLNLPMDTLNELSIKQLKDNEPVWLECDVLQEGYGEQQDVLAPGVYDWKNALGIDLNDDKTSRFEYHESLPSHAMLICGVDLEDGKPINWKIQSSWGAKVGRDGYFMMSNEWNNAYTYEVVVNKKYLNDTQLAALDKEPIVLPYWNKINPN